MGPSGLIRPTSVHTHVKNTVLLIQFSLRHALVLVSPDLPAFDVIDDVMREAESVRRLSEALAARDGHTEDNDGVLNLITSAWKYP